MADSGAWYGTVSGGDSAGGGKEFSYTQGAPRRTADPRAKAKRHAHARAKSKAAKKARRRRSRG